VAVKTEGDVDVGVHVTVPGLMAAALGIGTSVQ
jgi:hypothetical protein